MFRALISRAPWAPHMLPAAGARLLHSAAGFAGIEGLLGPRDWFKLAQNAAARCDELVRRAVELPPSAETVRTLDDISDVLCQVLDAAEFCRNAHVDQDWRSAAQQVCIDLGGYVQQLNTHYGLYTALNHALDRYQAEASHAAAAAGEAAEAGGANSSGGSERHGSAGSNSRSGGGEGWSEETLLVARMLKRDFEKYGVHLSGGRRDRMNELVQRTQGIGMGITRNIVTPDHVGMLELHGEAAEATQHLPRHLQRAFRPVARKWTGQVLGLSAPADSQLLNALMLNCPEEEVRKQAYLASTQQPLANVRLLDELVEARHEIAGLMGFSSYAHYQLDEVTLANRPEAVGAFMEHLSAAIRPKCEEEMGRLQEAKTRLQGGGKGNAQPVRPWDRTHLMSTIKGMESSRGVDLAALPQYFRVEDVVEGMSGLLRTLMGVSLEERPLEPGEGWAPGVRKLAAVHDGEGFLGNVYLDLYQRASGKFPGAAHFTLRCGRRLPDGSYQTPVVALLANLAPASDLAHSEAETLFHEFGHAVHSLLSRTQYQHLAGTRGPLDTVEIPSHTMEHFALDPRVLQTFARHKSSGQPLPEEYITGLRDSRRLFAGLDLEAQLVYCAVDQLLHGPDPPTGERAQRAVGEIMEQYSSFGYWPGTWPHIRFNHIVGYGATYYSYLYAQCLSSNIWRRHLEADPLSRTAGEALRHQLLEAGGAKEAHTIVEGILGGAMMHAAHGGWYPDAHSMLAQQGLAAA